MRVLQGTKGDGSSYPKGECILLLPRPSTDARQRYLNQELRLLVKSAQYRVKTEYELLVNNSKYLFSYYSLQEITHDLEEDHTPLKIIVGTRLSPKQHINLEQMFPFPIRDKFDLVLEIFAARAMTEEAILQIELAELRYKSPRERVRFMHQLGLEGAFHTERSGFWSTGENPLNRMDASVTKKESRLRKRLAVLRHQREDKRGLRKRVHQDSLYCCLVGYTSAGKSTILNGLTGSTVGVSSRLFETLDTRVRSFPMDDLKIFVTDTVGFIEDLPTFLIDSFKSTLEEGLAADVLIVVIDGSDSPMLVQQKSRLINQTITEDYPDNRRIIVLSKTDLFEDPLKKEAIHIRLSLLREEFPGSQIIPISAIQDIRPLIEAIGTFRPKQSYRCKYPPNHQFRSFCYESTHVEKEQFFPDVWVMEFTTRKPGNETSRIQNKGKILGIEIEIENLTSPSIVD